MNEHDLLYVDVAHPNRKELVPRACFCKALEVILLLSGIRQQWLLLSTPSGETGFIKA